jgi:peptidoglycan/xylan/chitin deacetylase (PgdA/CDA1 family)
MDRRAFLSGSVLLGLTGCTSTDDERTDDDDEESPDSEEPAGNNNQSETEDEESRPAVTTLDDFSDLDRWNTIEGALSSTPEHQTDSQAAQIEIAPADTRGVIERGFDDSIDLSKTQLGAIIQSDTEIAILLQALDSDGTRVDFRTLVRADLPYQPYDFGVASDDPAFNRNEVVELRIVAHTGSGGETVSILCDELYLMPRPETPLLMIHFDDANETDYTEALPVLNQYGYQAATFINTNRIGHGQNLSVEQTIELSDAGWDVCSHCADHPDLTELSTDEQEQQIREAKEWLREYGFEQGAEYFAYPYSSYDTSALTLAEEYHTLGFVAGSPACGWPRNPLLIPRGGGGDPEVDDAQTAIDQTVRWNGITSVLFHSLEADDDPNRRNRFEEIIEYIHEYESTGDLQVVTPRTIKQHHPHF